MGGEMAGDLSGKSIYFNVGMGQGESRCLQNILNMFLVTFKFDEGI